MVYATDLACRSLCVLMPYGVLSVCACWRLVAVSVQKDKEKEEKSSKVEELKLPEMGIEEKKILKELMKACVFQGV